MQVDYNNYKEKAFTCSKCGWKGKGTELSNGDFNEVYCIGDLECPECDYLIAFWQAPLSESK